MEVLKFQSPDIKFDLIRKLNKMFQMSCMPSLLLLTIYAKNKKFACKVSGLAHWVLAFCLKFSTFCTVFGTCMPLFCRHDFIICVDYGLYDLMFKNN